jgi:hypothetical protein
MAEDAQTLFFIRSAKQHSRALEVYGSNTRGIKLNGNTSRVLRTLKQIEALKYLGKLALLLLLLCHQVDHVPTSQICDQKDALPTTILGVHITCDDKLSSGESPFSAQNFPELVRRNQDWSPNI